MLSVVVRHTARLDRAQKTWLVLLFDPKFFLRLAVDQRGAALFDSQLVAAFQRSFEIARLGHVFAVRAQTFSDFVIADVLLKQMQAHGHRAAAVARPSAPSVVVV